MPGVPKMDSWVMANRSIKEVYLLHTAGQHFEVNVLRDMGELACVKLEYLQSTLDVWQRHHDVFIEAARPS